MTRKYVVRLPQILFNKRPVFVYAFHAVLVAASLVLGWSLRFDFSLPYRRVLLLSGLLLIVVRLITLRLFNLNHGWWHFASVSDRHSESRCSWISRVFCAQPLSFRCTWLPALRLLLGSSFYGMLSCGRPTRLTRSG
jgi:FlaA1/EpsC-like NDP-sugar epimerase